MSVRKNLEPAAAGAGDGAPAVREERVLTFSDVFGRDAGGLIVLLVLFGALTIYKDEFLTGANMANLSRQVAIFGIIAVGQLLADGAHRGAQRQPSRGVHVLGHAV